MRLLTILFPVSQPFGGGSGGIGRAVQEAGQELEVGAA